MIDPSFLSMLVCPSSRQPLREATAAELSVVNDAVGRGAAKNRGGAAVAQAIQAGLVTKDGASLYPIQDGIPILLATEAIPLPPA